MEKFHAVVLFVDLRGFTQWTEQIESVYVLQEFVHVCYEIAENHFPGTFRKGLGDGMMIVYNHPVPPHASAVQEMLGTLLLKMAGVERRIAALTEQVRVRYAHPTNLRLGWGVTRGFVQPLGGGDAVGGVVNESSRLCGLARPFGVIVDRQDFPTLPVLTGGPWMFREAAATLRGFTHPTPLWVSQDVVLQEA